MRKKDYELIAEWLKDYSYVAEVRTDDGEIGYSHKLYRGALDAFCTRLEKDNPKFDRNKFLQACGIETDERYSGIVGNTSSVGRDSSSL